MRTFAAILVASAATHLVHAVDNGLARTPPLGWNTWCTGGECGRDYCNEDEIKSVADYLVSSGMKDLGYTHVNMDDCWGGDGRTANGSYQWDPTRFPSGIPALADYVHSKGLTLGVYTDSGTNTCSSGGRSFKPPGAYGHYAQDANTFASWGVDFVKMDWCDTDVNGTQLDPHFVYATMSKALNETGRPILFNSCEWGYDNPWQWAGDYMNTWRIYQDHHDMWCCTSPPCLVCEEHSTVLVIEAFAGKGVYAGPGGWSDGDFVYTGGQGCPDNQFYTHCPGQSDTEYITEFSMWVMASSQLLVATDIRNMTEIMTTVLLNKEMLDVHQDPLGVAGDRIGFDTTAPCSELGGCQIWTKPLSGGSYAVALYNRDDDARNITVNFVDVHPAWLGTTPLTLRDLWAHENLPGTFQESYTAEVAAHGVVVVKATPQDGDSATASHLRGGQ